MCAENFIRDVNSAFSRNQSHLYPQHRVDRRIVGLQCDTWDGIPSYKNRKNVEELPPELLKVLHAASLQPDDTFVYTVDGRAYSVTATGGCWTFHQISGGRSIIGVETFQVYPVVVEKPYIPLSNR